MFSTKKDAMKAGYRPVNPARDRDTSQGHSYGYEWMSPEGEISVTVTLMDEINAIGQRGCVVSMYPPRPADFVARKPLAPDQVAALDENGYRMWLREASRSEICAYDDYIA